MNKTSAPISVIRAFFAIIFIGVAYWYKYTDQLFNDLILLLTLGVLIFYTYYTQQAVKAAYIAPAVLFVQKEHTAKIRQFLYDWNTELNCLPIYKNLQSWQSGIEPPYNDFIDTINRNRNIESRWEYNDLIRNHLPTKYCGLEEDWLSLNRSIEELGSKVDTLYKSIDHWLNEQLEEISKRYVHVRLGNRDEMEKMLPVIYRICFFSGDIKSDSDIRLEVVTSGDDVYRLIYCSDVILLGDTKEDLNEIAEELKNLIRRDNLKQVFREQIQEVKSYDKKMNKKRDEFKLKIEELIGLSLLPTKGPCDWLRDFK